MRTVTCPFCNGVGLKQDREGNYKNCRQCRGTGRLRALIPFQVFAKSDKRKFIWGLFWVSEALFELQIANWILPKYLWEIIGPVNVGLFVSTSVAAIYGAFSIAMSSFGLVRWFREKYQSVRL